VRRSNCDASAARLRRGGCASSAYPRTVGARRFSIARLRFSAGPAYSGETDRVEPGTTGSPSDRPGSRRTPDEDSRTRAASNHGILLLMTERAPYRDFAKGNYRAMLRTRGVDPATPDLG